MRHSRAEGDVLAEAVAMSSPKQKRVSDFIAEQDQSPTPKPSIKKELDLVRVGLEDLSSQMGKSVRNAITGKIKLQGLENFQDFVVVDLFARDHLSGTPEELAADPYLFKPVLLKYRTWLYHFDYISRTTNFERGEHSMLRQALDHICVDASVSAGRWSPLISYVPLTFCMAMTGDNLLVLVPLIMVGLLHAATNVANTVQWYKWLRPATFPFRFALFAFLVVRLATGFQDLQGISSLGLILALLVAMVDFAVGDGSMIFALRLQCCYEIMQVLPQRLFICQRKGACDLETLCGKRGAVSEMVSGFCPWESSHTLIADIQGIIVELRPMELKDWQRLTKAEKNLHFLGVDIYDNEIRSTAAFLKKQIDRSIYQSEC